MISCLALWCLEIMPMYSLIGLHYHLQIQIWREKTWKILSMCGHRYTRGGMPDLHIGPSLASIPWIDITRKSF